MTTLAARLKGARHSVAKTLPKKESVQDSQPVELTFDLVLTRGLADCHTVLKRIQGTAQEVLSELASEVIVSAKADAPLFSLGLIPDKLPAGVGLSKEDAFAATQGLALDFDDLSPAEWQRIRARLVELDLMCAVYPTFTWSPEAPRMRVVLLYSCPLPKAEHGVLCESVEALLGVASDTCSRKPAQRFYMPCRPKGCNFEARPKPEVIGAKLLNPSELLAKANPSAGQKLKAREFPDAAKINADVIGEPQRGDNRNRDIGLISKNCAFVAALHKGEPQSEPAWRVAAGIYNFCSAGKAGFREVSRLDTKGFVSDGDCDKKFDSWTAGPPVCGNSDIAAYCKKCAKFGKGASPVMFGDLPPDPKQEQADALSVLTQVLEPVMSSDGQLYYVMSSERDVRMVKTVVPAGSQAASDAIIARASAQGKAPSERAIEVAEAQFRHEARERGDAVAIHTRVACTGGAVFHDLGPGRVIEISAQGYRLVDDGFDGVPLFRRGSAAGELPDPVSVGTAEDALRFLVAEFHGTFGLNARNATVLVAVLLEWLRTDTPYVVLELVAPAGAGKSSLAECCVDLVDPTNCGRVTVGTDAKDFAAAAQDRHVLMIDNAGKVDKPFSDLLCIAATGGTLLVRQLYTNGEAATLRLHKPVVITAVSPVCTAADLATRVVRLELQARTSGFMPEAVLRERVKAVRPRMLGALYTLMSGALRELPAVQDRGGGNHRMVDFGHLGEAMVAASGVKPGAFTSILDDMRARMARRTASGDLFLTALMGVLRRLAQKPTHTKPPSLNAVLSLRPPVVVLNYETRVEIMARPGALHKEFPRSTGIDGAIPATERGLTDALRRVHPTLANLGIDLTERTSGSRTVLCFDFDKEAIRED